MRNEEALDEPGHAENDDFGLLLRVVQQKIVLIWERVSLLYELGMNLFWVSVRLNQAFLNVIGTARGHITMPSFKLSF